MSDVISDYQKWKQQGDTLRAQAKQAMQTRFRDLLSEAMQIAEEYRADFGAPLKPSAPVVAFRYKAPLKGKSKAKTAAKVKAAARPEPAKPNAQVQGIQKRLATAKRKLDEAKAAGKSTRALEDKIYEVEDELRLAAQTV
jgi:hypothetical protein